MLPGRQRLRHAVQNPRAVEVRGRADVAFPIFGRARKSEDNKVARMKRQRNPGRRGGIVHERRPRSLKGSAFTTVALSKAVASRPRIPLRFIRATVLQRLIQKSL